MISDYHFFLLLKLLLWPETCYFNFFVTVIETVNKISNTSMKKKALVTKCRAPYAQKTLHPLVTKCGAPFAPVTK